MRDAARALDDVSDHLGEVLRHADELLSEWARFGAQVRTQVDREAAAIGAVVDGAVERAASAGIDRAIAERLRALTTEIERIEQRARTAARVVTEQREADRRVLWIVVAGVVLANALLVVLLLRKPEVVRVPEPVRVESTTPATVDGEQGPPAHGASGDAPEVAPATASAGGSPASRAPTGSNAGSSEAGATSGSATAGAAPGADAAGALGTGKPAAETPEVPTPAAKAGTRRPAAKGVQVPASTAPTGGGRPEPSAAGAGRPMASPIVLPPKSGTARPHKKPS